MRLSILPLFVLGALGKQVVFQKAQPAVSDYAIESITTMVGLMGRSTKAQTALTLTPTRERASLFVLDLDVRPGHIEFSDAGRVLDAVEAPEADVPAAARVRYEIQLPPHTKTLTVLTVSDTHVTPVPADESRLTFQTSRWTYDLASFYRHQPDLSRLASVSLQLVVATPNIMHIAAPNGYEASEAPATTPQHTVTFRSRPGTAFTPGASEPASLTYAELTAVGAVRSLVRTADVSHWGNTLAISDDVDLYNAGDAPESFSRFDFMMMRARRLEHAIAINSIQFVLPPHAYDAYYYDTVGNVSWSHFRPGVGKTQPVLEVSPRYPIISGWRYSFTTGFKIPLSDLLRRVGRSYVLAVPYLTPLQGIPHEDTTLKIVLPEGAHIERVTLPFTVDTQTIGNADAHYLDILHRPQLTLTRANCTEVHGKYVYVTYTLSPFAELLQKPLGIAGVLFAFFAGFMVLKRI